MFTGLIEATGTLRDRKGSSNVRVWIEAGFADLRLGESISVNGVCLTVDRQRGGGFEADVSVETLARTTLGALTVGSTVHLERAMALGERLHGHIVLGHVDDVGVVAAREAAGDALRMQVTASAELQPFLAFKGSVAMDGVSLTLNRVTHDANGGRDRVAFEVMLVPHTLERTHLAKLQLGSRVNIEVDVLARYAVSALASGVLKMDGKSPRATNDERLFDKMRQGGLA